MPDLLGPFEQALLLTLIRLGTPANSESLRLVIAELV